MFEVFLFLFFFSSHQGTVRLMGIQTFNQCTNFQSKHSIRTSYVEKIVPRTFLESFRST